MTSQNRTWEQSRDSVLVLTLPVAVFRRSRSSDPSSTSLSNIRMVLTEGIRGSWSENTASSPA